MNANGVLKFGWKNKKEHIKTEEFIYYGTATGKKLRKLMGGVNMFFRKTAIKFKEQEGYIKHGLALL